jgi:uncharacterized protein (TIGR02145 family)
LSNRIDLKLTKTDTASLSDRIDAKLTKTDTASLSNRIDAKLTKTDTASLSNRIDTKLNRSDFPSGTNTGNILYWNGTTWVNLAPGQNGQALFLVNGIPTWSDAASATVPSAPTDVVATAGNGSASVSFVTPASNGGNTITGYVATAYPGGISATGTTSPINVTGLTNGTAYRFIVGLIGEESYSASTAVTPVTVPTTTTSLAYNTSTSGITTTTTLSFITSTSGFIYGNISFNGGASVSSRGFVYSTSSNPTLSNTVFAIFGTGDFSGTLTGLSPNTTYYVRAYATNRVGTAYGNEVSFTTLPPLPPLPPVIDIDGNTYNTVQIGNQVWMSENLKTSRYRNGGLIPNVTMDNTWANLTTGAWSYYNNDETNNAIYGKLYNWYTTLGDTLCPAGWHVPTNTEWLTLNLYLRYGVGGGFLSGTLMKKNDALWITNTGNNATGFSGLPGGIRESDGEFRLIGYEASFWSATVGNGIAAGYINLSDIAFIRDNLKLNGYSVRCLRD